VLHALEDALPGVTARAHAALQAVAHLRDRPEPTLADPPARLVLARLARAGPDAAAVVRDLARLFGVAAAARPPISAPPR